MTLDLGQLTAEEALSAVYIGYFDRAADPEGLDFWATVYTSQFLSLPKIATDFASQPESLETFDFLSNPSATSANGFIAQVYLNLFNRPPDPAGLTFWSDLLKQRIDGAGTLDIGQIILEIIGGAQNTSDGNDLTTMQNKIEVAIYWTEIAEDAKVDYQNDAAARASANAIIDDVTDDRNTVEAAKSTLDPFFDFVSGQPEISGSSMNGTAASALDESELSDSIVLIGLTPSESDFLVFDPTVSWCDPFAGMAGSIIG